MNDFDVVTGPAPGRVPVAREREADGNDLAPPAPPSPASGEGEESDAKVTPTARP